MREVPSQNSTYSNKFPADFFFFGVRRQIDGRRGRVHVAKFHVDTVSDEKVILEKPRGSDPTPQAVAG